MGKSRTQYKVLPEDRERIEKTQEITKKNEEKVKNKEKNKAKRKNNPNKVKRKNRDDTIEGAWKMAIPKFTKEDNPHGMLEQSSFATLFPQYREVYLKQVWPDVQGALSKYKIEAHLDLVEGSMTVSTTRKTWDPYSIIKARDIIKLLARSVPFETAVRVLEDDTISSDIIRIGSMVKNKLKFIKRRQRLIGPDGCTLKAIELLTRCYVMVQGSTVAAVGPFKGLANVRRVVEDTMDNIHPIYNIKALMIKRELAANPKMKHESWDRFLPNFKSRNVSKRKQPKIKHKNRPYTPFPPPAPLSKVDKALASGEYFLNPEQVRQRKEAARTQRNEEADLERQVRRESQYQRPEEPAQTSQPANQTGSSDLGVDVAALKKKLSKDGKTKNRKPY